jgi:LPS export ABC transporter protein LptC
MGPAKARGNRTAAAWNIPPKINGSLPPGAGALPSGAGKALLILLTLCLSWGCSFDYGAASGEDENQPDIVMSDVEYVRVRDGDPVVRFAAESAERYETRQTMELKNFSFEQFDSHGDEINAVGSAGAASVDLESGDIKMQGGVRIAVDSEDVTIETPSLDWQDKERRLSGSETGRVDIQRSNGTNFSGRGFSADIRDRTWSFASGAEGSYIHDDDEDDDADEDGSDEDGEAEETPAEAEG